MPKRGLYWIICQCGKCAHEGGKKGLFTWPKMDVGRHSNRNGSTRSGRKWEKVAAAMREKEKLIKSGKETFLKMRKRSLFLAVSGFFFWCFVAFYDEI